MGRRERLSSDTGCESIVAVKPGSPSILTSCGYNGIEEPRNKGLTYIGDRKVKKQN